MPLHTGPVSHPTLSDSPLTSTDLLPAFACPMAVRIARRLAALLLVLVVAAGCDFGAAEDAVDDFAVLVGFPSLTTIVNLQVIDASSGGPVAQEVHVAFEGDDAAAVVDVYSDPLSDLQVQEGFASFAIDSTRRPSPERPARITLRATAEGYIAASTAVRLTREGTATRVLRLTPTNAEKAPPGAAGRRTSVGIRADGTTGRTVDVSAGPTVEGPEGAQGRLVLPEGTALRTADGTPLQGQATLDLSVLDNSPEAQALLPVAARTIEGGGRRQIRGAVRFRVADAGGRVAGQFGVAGGDTTTVTARLPTLDGQVGTPTVTLVDPESGTARTVALSGGSTPQARGPQPKQKGTVTFRLVDKEVLVMAADGATATLDRASFSEGFFAAVGLDPQETCTPQGTLVLDPNGQDGPVGLRASGSGFAVDASVDIPDPQSSFSISVSSLLGGEIPDVGPVSLTLRTPDDQKTSTTVDLCSGTETVMLPAPAPDRIDATVRVVPNCPPGERLPISPPFDGYSVAYRLGGSTGPYRTVPNENIAFDTSEDNLQTVTAALVPVSNVVPAANYDFVATFGEVSSRQEVTMPAQDGGEATVTDPELQEECQ